MWFEIDIPKDTDAEMHTDTDIPKDTAAEKRMDMTLVFELKRDPLMCFLLL